MVDILTLISEERTVDEYGDMQVAESERRIFCRTESIGMKEFYQSQAVGLQPEVKFVLFDYLDYHGEQIVEYAGYRGANERYRVIRIYRNGKELELTCKRGVD